MNIIEEISEKDLSKMLGISQQAINKLRNKALSEIRTKMLE